MHMLKYAAKDIISIHALHEESDQAVGRAHDERLISIHALHEESDPVAETYWIRYDVFQSTLSMRRATCTIPAVYYANRYFNPRSP